jgi:hypothetical protein
MKTLAQFIFESQANTSEEDHFAEHGFKRTEDSEKRDGSTTRRYEHPDGHSISVYGDKKSAKAPYLVRHVNGANGGPRYNKKSKDHISAIKAFKRIDADAAKEAS